MAGLPGPARAGEIFPAVQSEHLVCTRHCVEQSPRTLSFRPFTKALRGKVTLPRSHSRSVAEQRFEPRLQTCKTESSEEHLRIGAVLHGQDLWNELELTRQEGEKACEGEYHVCQRLGGVKEYDISGIVAH